MNTQTAITQAAQDIEHLRFDLSRALGRIPTHHFYMEEDAWYACPQHPECSNDNIKGQPCSCGADERKEFIRRMETKYGITAQTA